MKQKPLQNIAFGADTKILETMVSINEITLEGKSNST